jgi:hypothetical protein
MFFRRNASSLIITEGMDTSLLDGGLELGILSVMDSNDFPKIDLVIRPPSLVLLYPPTSIMVNL